MQRRLKERLIGAAVLVMLAVIIIPMVLDNTSETGPGITRTNIPPRPETKFSSRIIPVEEPPPVTAPEQQATVAGERDTQSPMPSPGSPAASTSVPTPSPRVPDPVATDPVTEAESPPSASGDVGVSAWVVQLGSFSSEANANALNTRLREAGFSAFVEPLRQDSTLTYRVRVGPELQKPDAQALRKRIMDKLQVEGIVIQYP